MIRAGAEGVIGLNPDTIRAVTGIAGIGVIGVGVTVGKTGKGNPGKDTKQRNSLP